MTARKQEAVLRTRIGDVGLRVTASRLAVLEKLVTAKRAMSHSEMAAELDDRKVDRATIFRNLQDLTHAGIVSRKDLGDHVWRYEPSPHASLHGFDEHPHFVCKECGAVSCLVDFDFSLEVPATAPAAVREGKCDIVFRGRCDACLSRGARRREA